MVKVAGQLGELGPCALLLPFLLVLADLLIVFVQVPPYFFVLRLHVLQILLTRVEVVLPTSDIVPSVAVKGDKKLG